MDEMNIAYFPNKNIQDYNLDNSKLKMVFESDSKEKVYFENGL